MRLFRKSDDAVPPQVEWITKTPGLAETYPILPARKALPQWLKDSEATITADRAHGHGMPGMQPPPQPQGPPMPKRARDTTPTIRHCPGVIDVMRMGYILRAWTDIEIITPEPPTESRREGFMSMTSMNPQEIGGSISSFGPHLNQKFPLWPGEYGFALKLDSPWVCKLPPGWSLLYMPIPYAEKQPFRVIHGITDNDEFHVVNILAMWDHHGAHIIEAGTPICQLVPVRRDGFQMETDVRFDPERYDLLHSLGKGGVGSTGGRLITGSYVRERIKRQRAAKEG